LNVNLGTEREENMGGKSFKLAARNRKKSRMMAKNLMGNLGN
jgi:hypothetical protein